MPATARTAARVTARNIVTAALTAAVALSAAGAHAAHTTGAAQGVTIAGGPLHTATACSMC